jgi:hypothetical protein
MTEDEIPDTPAALLTTAMFPVVAGAAAAAAVRHDKCVRKAIRLVCDADDMRTVFATAATWGAMAYLGAKPLNSPDSAVDVAAVDRRTGEPVNLDGLTSTPGGWGRVNSARFAAAAHIDNLGVMRETWDAIPDDGEGAHMAAFLVCLVDLAGARLRTLAGLPSGRTLVQGLRDEVTAVAPHSPAVKHLTALLEDVPAAPGYSVVAEYNRPDLLEPRTAGEHVWTVSAVYRVSADHLAAGVGQSILDRENLAAIAAGCFTCEAPYSAELAAQPCPGDPGDQ